LLYNNIINNQSDTIIKHNKTRINIIHLPFYDYVLYKSTIDSSNSMYLYVSINSLSYIIISLKHIKYISLKYKLLTLSSGCLHKFNDIISTLKIKLDSCFSKFKIIGRYYKLKKKGSLL